MNITATLIGQMITFAVLVWFVQRFLWEPMLRMLEDRKARVAEGLAAAERGKHEHEMAQNRALELIKEGKQQSAELIAQAQRRASEIVDEAKDQARIEAALAALAPTLLALDHADATRLCEQLIRAYDPCISCATHFLRLEIEDSGAGPGS